MNLLKLMLGLSLIAPFAYSAESTINALNKTGGKTANYIRVERCADGTIAIANDFNELVRQQVTNPCAANAAQSSGFIKNIGKQEVVNYSVSNCSVYIGLNSIGNGFHVMYTSGSNGVCQVQDLAAEKEFASSIHKCLLLLKNKLASEMLIQTDSRNVNCDSK